MAGGQRWREIILRATIDHQPSANIPLSAHQLIARRRARRVGLASTEIKEALIWLL
jgi:hypothetical protein